LQAEAQKLGVTKETMGQADPQAIAYLETLATLPVAQQVVGMENNVGELDVDIIVDEGIDTPTVQAEQFDKIASMMGNAPPQIAVALWGMLIESSALDGKEKLAEALKQPPAPEQQAMQQIQMDGAVAEVDKTKSETVKNLAQAQAADPNAQMQLEGAKAAHGAQLAEAKQAHGMQLAERNQALKEQMAARQPRKAA
jgi:hypothetical protein